jgi:hypothetical protein
VEKDGMESLLEVNVEAARKNCEGKLRQRPLASEFSFCMEKADASAVEDVNSFIPGGGFTLKSNAEYEPSAQPKCFKLPLLPEQLRSIGWMLSREREAVQTHGLIVHKSIITVPPFNNVQVKWRLKVHHTLRGGILCDSVGFGKTAVAIGLIALAKEASLSPPRLTDKHSPMIPVRAALVVVPNHLVAQWEAQIVKFAGTGTGTGSGLKVIAIASVNDIPTVGEIAAADIVLLQQGLFDSKAYQRDYLHIDLDTATCDAAVAAGVDPHSAEAKEENARYENEVLSNVAEMRELRQKAAKLLGKRATNANIEKLVVTWMGEKEAVNRGKKRARESVDQSLRHQGKGTLYLNAVEEELRQIGQVLQPNSSAYASTSTSSSTSTLSPTSTSSSNGVKRARSRYKTASARSLFAAASLNDATTPIGTSPEATSDLSGGVSSAAAILRARKVPLEAFHWSRLIVDEVHELAQAEDVLGATWTLPIR